MQKQPPQKSSEWNLDIVTQEESSKNHRYMKAGAVVAGLAYGVLPYVVGAVVAYQAASPYVAEAVSFVSRPSTTKQFDDAPAEWLSFHSPPVSYIRLKGEIADGYAGEKDFASSIGVSYCWNVVLYKIVWEHIRITGGRTYRGYPEVNIDHVRRKMSESERSQFLVFLTQRGNMSNANVKIAQL